MKYKEILQGKFISRPNRFVAHVDIGGEDTVVHVKNTGRCRELLEPGNTVILSHSDNPGRKTAYDLVAVYRKDGRLINMDSQAPNKVVGEWLQSLGCFEIIRPEYTIGDSRFDFYMEKGGQPYLLEVKGCTLIRGNVGYFPDAPTERGVKHLRELAALTEKGFRCSVAFVIQTNGISEVRPNRDTHPEFGIALDEAVKAGVKQLDPQCHVSEDGFCISIDAKEDLLY